MICIGHFKNVLVDNSYGFKDKEIKSQETFMLNVVYLPESCGFGLSDLGCHSVCLQPSALHLQTQLLCSS